MWHGTREDVLGKDVHLPSIIYFKEPPRGENVPKLGFLILKNFLTTKSGMVFPRGVFLGPGPWPAGRGLIIGPGLKKFVWG